jgi:cardiolipin synthase (CMP-forming)
MASAARGRPAARSLLGRCGCALRVLAPFYAANALTGARALSVPPLVALVLWDRSGAALLLFIVAALTDVADGFVAKRFNGVTSLGAMLDPAADKLLVGGLVIALTWTGAVPLWFAAMVLMRDLLLVWGAFHLRQRRRDYRIEPLVIGKISTLLQMLYLGAVLALLAGFTMAQPALDLLLPAATLVTAVSASIYALSAFGLRQHADRT